MSKTRKNCLIFAGVCSIIMCAFFIMTFVFVLTDFNGLKQYLINMINENNLNTGNMGINSFINFTLTYFIISAIVGVVFAVIYFKYSKYTYAQFLKCRKSLLIISVINILIGFAFLQIIFILLALNLPPNQKEYNSVKNILNNIKSLGVAPEMQSTQTVNNVGNELNTPNETQEKLFVNVSNIKEEINKLRVQKENNEITNIEYEKKLNKILENNIKL